MGSSFINRQRPGWGSMIINEWAWVNIESQTHAYGFGDKLTNIYKWAESNYRKPNHIHMDWRTYV